MKDVKLASMITVTMYTVDCPHCGSEESGFYGDVRGSIQECDECGEQYEIDESPEFQLT
jgi:transcription elongation factor Elf1|tara:strand:- start:891 stop:1067 length:177 start_codon:yes stop_codon:yes gene_type:complete